jgi:hypothetical protein
MSEKTFSVIDDDGTVHYSWIVDVPEQPEPAPPPYMPVIETEFMKVVSSTLNIRTAPDNSNPDNLLGHFANGAIVEVLKEQTTGGDWVWRKALVWVAEQNASNGTKLLEHISYEPPPVIEPPIPPPATDNPVGLRTVSEPNRYQVSTYADIPDHTQIGGQHFWYFNRHGGNASNHPDAAPINWRKYLEEFSGGGGSNIPGRGMQMRVWRSIVAGDRPQHELLLNFIVGLTLLEDEYWYQEYNHKRPMAAHISFMSGAITGSGQHELILPSVLDKYMDDGVLSREFFRSGYLDEGGYKDFVKDAITLLGTSFPVSKPVAAYELINEPPIHILMQRAANDLERSQIIGEYIAFAIDMIDTIAAIDPNTPISLGLIDSNHLRDPLYPGSNWPEYFYSLIDREQKRVLIDCHTYPVLGVTDFDTMWANEASVIEDFKTAETLKLGAIIGEWGGTRAKGHDRAKQMHRFLKRLIVQSGTAPMYALNFATSAMQFDWEDGGGDKKRGTDRVWGPDKEGEWHNTTSMIVKINRDGV